MLTRPLIKGTLSLASPAGPHGRLTTFIFHRVLPEVDALFPGEPTVDRFDELMGWISHWFNVLPLEQAVRQLRCGDLPARAAAITFDDGYADNFVHATPVLKKHGLHATFFIASGFLDGGCMWNDTVIEAIRRSHLAAIGSCDIPGFIGASLTTIDEKRQAIQQIIGAIKHLPATLRQECVNRIHEVCATEPVVDLMLTSAQLCALHRAGMGIGAHTVNHPILATLDSQSARKEIADGRESLESILGEKVSLFAYPNGVYGKDYHEEHVALVQSLGFAAAVSTNWGAASTRSNIFQIPRFTPWDTAYWRFGLRLMRNYGNTFPGINGAGNDFQRPVKVPVPVVESDLPVISVVIPCFNAERWIASTLRSVFRQDWPNLEVIVVDDGSTDNSVALIEREFPEVLLLRQSNQGVAAARNHGIRKAKGTFIAFVDADDIWLPGKLSAQWAALRQQKDARVVYTAWQVWPSSDPDPSPETLDELKALEGDSLRWQGATGWVYPDLLLSCAVWTSTVLAEKSVFDEVGVFDEKLRIGEDYDLWLRVSRVTPIIRVARPLALYRAHPSSVTRSVAAKNYQALVINRALKRWGYASPDGTKASRVAVARSLACSWRDFAGGNLDAGNLGRSWSAILHALRLNFLNTASWQLLAKIALKSGNRLLYRGR